MNKEGLILVKSSSDLLVLYQYTNKKLGEPSRWILYDLHLDKSPHPDIDRARAVDLIKIYSIIDKSAIERAMFDLTHSPLFFLTKCNQGSSVACVKFEYIARCMLTMSSMKCDTATDYNAHLSTVINSFQDTEDKRHKMTMGGI